jgi:hypothetical protein
MKKPVALFFIAAILHQTNFAQTSFPVSSFKPTPEDFKLLLLTNKEIAANDTINEKILDLAEPMLLDSILHRKKQHHRLFLVGWLIHAFGGYNWRAVDMHKQKFVGTVAHEGRSGGFEYTEWDIKYHLRFHLQKYLFKDFTAYDLQRKYHRQDVRPTHHTNYKVPPFVRDTNNIDGTIYDLGCELTPPPAFIPQLNYLFFPTLPNGGNCQTHQNFECKNPSMGFYGAYCLDCNHNCHPEMHPYEWTWWLNLKNQKSTDKEWLVGLFHEGSNRFPKWSTNPMTGEIKIPFAFDKTEDLSPSLQIKIEHLVFNKFEDAELKKLNVPEKSFGTSKNIFFEFIINDSTNIESSLEFSQPVKTEGLKYWFTDLNYDKQNRVLSGYFHLAISVQDLYTTRITFTSEYGD